MNNDKLLKLYLGVGSAFAVLFTLSFVMSVNAFNDMWRIYLTTLPFLVVSVLSFLCFGFAPQSVECGTAHNNIIRLRRGRGFANERIYLKKIC